MRSPVTAVRAAQPRAPKGDRRSSRRARRHSRPTRVATTALALIPSLQASHRSRRRRSISSNTVATESARPIGSGVAGSGPMSVPTVRVTIQSTTIAALPITPSQMKSGGVTPRRPPPRRAARRRSRRKRARSPTTLEVLGGDGVMDGRRTRRGGCNRVSDQRKVSALRERHDCHGQRSDRRCGSDLRRRRTDVHPHAEGRRRRCGDDRDGDSGRARHTRCRARFQPSYGMFGHSAGLG